MFGPLYDATGSVGDTTVSDEVIDLEVQERSDLPTAPSELRYLAYVGLFDQLAEVSLRASGSDTERAELLGRSLRAVGSAEPVVRFARFEQGSALEALERASRMRGRDIGATERWLIPRLEGDIAAYRARIAALRLATGDGTP